MGEIEDVCLRCVFSNGLRILQRVELYHGAAEKNMDNYPNRFE